MSLREKLAFKLLGIDTKGKNPAGGPYNFIPSWMNKVPQYKDWNVENAVREGYKASVWVYACIKKLATQSSSVRLTVYQKQKSSDKKWVENTECDLAKLLQKPNPFHPSSKLIESLTTFMNLAGSAPWYLNNINGVPKEIWWLNPRDLNPIPDQYNYISAYQYLGNGMLMNYQPEEIIDFKFFHPENDFIGLSPLMAAAKIVDNDTATVDWNVTSLQNRTVTDYAFVAKNPFGNESQWKEAESHVKKKYGGKVKAREPWVLSNFDVVKLGLTPVEMDFIESRKINREEICAVFGVPPVVLGIQDKSTYNNYLIAKRALWEDTIIPFLESIKEVLNLSLAPRFGDEFSIELDLNKVTALNGILKDKADAAKIFVDMGVPINQVIDKLNLPFDPIDGGDVPKQTSQLPLVNNQNKNKHLLMERKAKAKKILQTKSKDDLWNEFIDSTLEPEAAIKTVWRKALRLQKKAMLSKLEEKGLHKIYSIKSDSDISKEQLIEMIENAVDDAEIYSLIENILKDTVKSFGDSSLKSIGSLDLSFDVSHPEVTKWLEKYAGEQISEINETTKQQVKNILSDAYENGDSITNITKSLSEIFDDESRCTTIARTEVIGASNKGALEGYRQSGVVEKKGWLTAIDGRERDWHAKMDSQEVGIDEDFVSGLGNKTQSPGGFGVGNEDVNCRCCIYPVIE